MFEGCARSGSRSSPSPGLYPSHDKPGKGSVSRVLLARADRRPLPPSYWTQAVERASALVLITAEMQAAEASRSKK